MLCNARYIPFQLWQPVYEFQQLLAEAASPYT